MSSELKVGGDSSLNGYQIADNQNDNVKVSKDDTSDDDGAIFEDAASDVNRDAGVDVENESNFVAEEEIAGLEKDMAKSVAHKELGNALFKDKRYDNAIDEYSLAIGNS